MAGLGQEAVVPIRPDLATNLQPLRLDVQQNAVALVADSFRQGQISANDIIERYGALAKGKEKMQIQGIDEFLNPAAIQTRQNQQAAANTEAILKSSPEYIAAREAEMQSTINAAQAGSYPDMLKAAVGLGFFPQNRDATWTDAKKQEIAQLFSDARNYKAFSEKSARDAKRFLPAKEPVETLFTNAEGKQERTVESPTDEDVNYYDENNQHIPKEVKFAADRAAGMSADDWVRAGKPAYDPYGSLVTERAAPAAAKGQVEPEVYDTETSIHERKADGSTKDTVTRKTPRRITKQETTPGSPTGKQPTEKQVLAQLALPGIINAQDIMANFEKSGYNPSAFLSSVWGLADKMPAAWTADNRKDFQNAIQTFDEGMLRLVSGASIGVKEHATYREMYFPMPGDSVALQQRKSGLRNGIAVMTARLAEEKRDIQPGTPEAAAFKKIYEEGEKIGASYGGTSTQAGTVTPVTGGSVDFTPGKGYVFTAGVPSTNAPMVTPPPVVTPR